MSTQVLMSSARSINPPRDYLRMYIMLALLAVLVSFSLFAAGLLLSGQVQISKIAALAEQYYNSTEIVAEQAKASLNFEERNLPADINFKISQIIKHYNPQITDSAKFAALINESASKYSIDIYLLSALIYQESKFNNLSLNSEKIGLFMISSAEAQILSAELKLPFMRAALYNPNYNIQLGAYKLSRLLEITKGDTEKALVAFKAGEFSADGFTVAEVDPSLLQYKDAVLADAKKFAA